MNDFIIVETKTNLEEELINYYEAFELLFEGIREYGSYKTHFGILEKPLDEEYCWFRFVSRPDMFTKYCRHIRAGLLRFHLRLFYSDNYGREYDKVLDVGFGTGGTMQSLSTEWPEIEIHGINLNKIQHDIAVNANKEKNNMVFHLGNFLTYNFKEKYDLVYFIESAFHISNKEALVNKINMVCSNFGDVYITDIVYSEKFANKAKTKHVEDTIFNYLSLNDWIELFEKNGFEFIEFDDLSPQVANMITITTPSEDFKKDFVNPMIEKVENKQLYETQIMGAFKSYSKLQRLLKLKILQYGIMRFRKNLI